MSRLVDNTIISLSGSNENFSIDNTKAQIELDTTRELLLKNHNTQELKKEEKHVDNTDDETIILAQKATSHKSLYSNGQLSLNTKRSVSYCPNEDENDQEEEEEEDEEVQFEMNNHSDEEILSQSLNRYTSLSNSNKRNRHQHMNSKSRLRTKSTSSSSYINQAVSPNDLTHM